MLILRYVLIFERGYDVCLFLGVRYQRYYCIYPKDSTYAYFRKRGLHVCIFSGMCLFLNKGRMYAYFRGSNIKILFLMFSLDLLSGNGKLLNRILSLMFYHIESCRKTLVPNINVHFQRERDYKAHLCLFLGYASFWGCAYLRVNTV